MGDRGNIAVQDKGRRVYFYAHWSGSRLPEVVRKALAKGWRYNDPPYLARIIFDVLTDGRHGEETSFGISTEICDNEYPIVVVDCDTNKVRFEGEGAPDTTAQGGTPFAEYAAQEEATYPEI